MYRAVGKQGSEISACLHVHEWLPAQARQNFILVVHLPSKPAFDPKFKFVLIKAMLGIALMLCSTVTRVTPKDRRRQYTALSPSFRISILQDPETTSSTSQHGTWPSLALYTGECRYTESALVSKPDGAFSIDIVMPSTCPAGPCVRLRSVAGTMKISAKWQSPVVKIQSITFVSK
jgi:hypothetical protein